MHASENLHSLACTRQNVRMNKAHTASLHKSRNCCIILQCTHQKPMKIVTWNVNGLRAVLNRRFGSLKSLLLYLKAGANVLAASTVPWHSLMSGHAVVADVVCLQETKLSKADMSKLGELTNCAGWYGRHAAYASSHVSGPPFLTLALSLLHAGTHTLAFAQPGEVMLALLHSAKS
ncbi:hypothetical protein ABBQ32_012778 [Trebouxia sp. C0010 RCD-2024]